MVGAPMAIWRKSAFTSLMSTSTSIGCSPGLGGLAVRASFLQRSVCLCLSVCLSVCLVTGEVGSDDRIVGWVV